MSLEKLIAENTAALLENTTAIQQFAATGAGAAAPSPAAEKPKAAKKTKKKVEEVEEVEEAETTGIPYDDVKAKTVALVKAGGRDAAVSLLEDFGKDVKSAKDLEESQYAEYIDRANQLIEEADIA